MDNQLSAIITPEKWKGPEEEMEVTDETQKQKETPSKLLPSILQLNVGGWKFQTSRDTLTRVPDSYFSRMFSGRFNETQLMDSDGAVFIDRDGSHFRHILNFLRAGSVITLPKNEDDKMELSVEADFYGLDDMVKAIRLPKVDTTEILSEEVLAYRSTEVNIRKNFYKGHGRESNPFETLIPLFDEDDGIRPLPIRYEGPSPEMRRDSLFMGRVLFFEDEKHEEGSPPPVCVGSVADFESNFNAEHPNILHRITPILLEENIIIAGGSVLRALTRGSDIRASGCWNTAGQDIDLFLYCENNEKATAVSKRIFNALAVDLERWVVIRCRGVINIHQIVQPTRWETSVEQKIQIVLRLYDSPAEVLLGFDVDCCCCAFDGKNVWITPRCLHALKTGVNILNPLHALPNKACYEIRLAKYATRGFGVFVPGINKARIDYNLIHNADKVFELEGLARFLKISAEMESHSFMATTGGTVLTTKNPRHVHRTLREEYFRGATEDEKLLEFRANLGYDDLTCGVIVPTVYSDHNTDMNGQVADSMWWQGFMNWPHSVDTRDGAWAEIVNCETPPDGVTKRLIDAWQTEKRSREYLNGEMDPFDLDNLYYDHAYKDV